MRCTHCNNEISKGSIFCNHCGFKTEPQSITCQNKECRKSGLPLDAMFCPDCGTKISENKEYEYISVLCKKCNRANKIFSEDYITLSGKKCRDCNSKLFNKIEFSDDILVFCQKCYTENKIPSNIFSNINKASCCECGDLLFETSFLSFP